MPNYRRVFIPGGTYFFTVVTYKRNPIFAKEPARRHLRESFRQVNDELPFETVAFVLLPDHLHCVWTLPENDTDYSKRWGKIKACFTKHCRHLGTVEKDLSLSRRKHRESATWQRRFWEHAIRDEEDLHRHIDYIHYNPVKHGLAKCAHDWPFSTFHRWQKDGFYSADWCCCCDGKSVVQPDFSAMNEEMLK